jgi:hypothetical protein
MEETKQRLLHDDGAWGDGADAEAEVEAGFALLSSSGDADKYYFSDRRLLSSCARPEPKGHG